MTPDHKTGQIHDDPQCSCVATYGYQRCRNCCALSLWCRLAPATNECDDCTRARDFREEHARERVR
jgi:hypothetical protein